MAGQIVMLAPGRYRLETTVSSAGRSGPSAIFWRLACRESDSELLSLPLGLVTSVASRLGTDFVVPEGCKGQTLSLSALPFEFAEAETIWIHQVQIRPRT
jgi:hypothetical protein